MSYVAIPVSFYQRLLNLLRATLKYSYQTKPVLLTNENDNCAIKRIKNSDVNCFEFV